MTIRTLVLSGGGGRGAFHAGVYRYLIQASKEGVDDAHRGAWIPDVVVGTSIGAVNGAAIVQGTSPEELEAFWRTTRENDIQGLPPGMRGLSRWVANYLLRSTLGVRLSQIRPPFSTSPQERWEPLPFLPRWLSRRLVGHWNNLLDTGPLYHTLTARLRLDENKIMASKQTLLINATNVRTGELTIFSNQVIRSRKTGQPREDIKTGITLKRILASCSIPLVYPWTVDDDGEVYWDGAVVANTPLSAALDAVNGQKADEPMEVIVVLLPPWRKGELGSNRLPESFVEAATWTLEWALLATFRERLKLTEAYNRLARMEHQQSGPEASSFREINFVVIAPEEFFPLTRILDYDKTSAQLIDLGYRAAERAFHEHFGRAGTLSS